MDPAEADRLMKALLSQGGTIGQHDLLLRQAMESLQQLSANVDRLGNSLESVSTQLAAVTPADPPPVPPPPATASLTTMPHQPREPYIPILARYSGDLGTCFFTSVH